MNRLLFYGLVWVLALCDCTGETSIADSDAEAASPPPAAKTTGASGRVLVEKYCQSCHLLPEPDLLDKKTWKAEVLPNMGGRLGIRYNDYDPFEGVAPEELEALKNLNVYPEQPQLSETEWLSIVEYYENLAPAHLPDQERTTVVAPDPPPFSPSELEIGDKLMPQVTLLQYNRASGTLFIGDALQLYALNRQGSIIGNWETQTPSVDLSLNGQGIFVLSIGEFKPSEKREGIFFPLSLNQGQAAEDFVITGLPRPVQFTTGDLNEDQKTDLLICGFGNHRGQLAWYDNYDMDKVHVLSNHPGARKAMLRDLNGDGHLDILALMAQAWEKLVVYYNDGSGNFREKTLLEFPAVYGSSYFDLVDFNQDGHADILLTNGDNWDYSTLDKPYHGLRIYLNDGSNQFRPAYFFPMYGCSEARAVDFDRDGDLDIAAIAFYNDQIRNPGKSFVYLENDGQLDFTAFYMNETDRGAWLTMDTGDFNQDGFPDIFLGSYFHNINELSKLMAKGGEALPEVLLLTYRK